MESRCRHSWKSKPLTCNFPEIISMLIFEYIYKYLYNKSGGNRGEPHTHHKYTKYTTNIVHTSKRLLQGLHRDQQTLIKVVSNARGIRPGFTSPDWTQKAKPLYLNYCMYASPREDGCFVWLDASRKSSFLFVICCFLLVRSVKSYKQDLRLLVIWARFLWLWLWLYTRKKRFPSSSWLLCVCVKAH